LILPSELAKHAVSAGTKAVTKFAAANDSSNRVERKTMQEKAGLKFSVSRTSNFFKKYNTRVGQGAPVYLASVLEYVTAELLDLCKDIISSRQLKLVIERDDELKQLCKVLCFDIADGGVLPKYNPMDEQE
jgi:histone H2A